MSQNAMSFKAFAVANEIDLNKIANDCGIPKKYTWEEPLILKGTILGRILEASAETDQQVLVFSFGSIVFINHVRREDISVFLCYVQRFEADVNTVAPERYSDDYSLHIGGTDSLVLTDEFVMVPEYAMFYPELISTVIAKSVALEKTEEELGRILDRLEVMIDRLEKGKLRVSDKELARTTARIVRHEYNTIAYIMILDKPDITWTNSGAAELYDRMSEFFELNDRYSILKNKTEILSNMMEGFSAISHSIRGMFVEWVIVLLIVAEVILMCVEIVK